MTRVLWIDPVGHADFSDEILDILKSVVRSETEVEITSHDRGPHHVEYGYYESLVLPDTLHAVKRAENEGIDAVVIGCFYDLGLDEAREISESMAVVAPAEATSHLAATLGDRFSVVVGRRKWIPQMRERIHRYVGDNLASFKPIEMGVLDFQQEPRETRSRLTAAAKEAVVEDGAEAIILGCTIEYGFYKELQRDLGVPVLDAVTAPIKYAEFLAELGEFGWTHSKVGAYERPPTDEIESWDIPSDYDGANVW